jgi:hypothetical protein
VEEAAGAVRRINGFSSSSSSSFSSSSSSFSSFLQSFRAPDQDSPFPSSSSALPVPPQLPDRPPQSPSFSISSCSLLASGILARVRNDPVRVVNWTGARLALFADRWDLIGAERWFGGACSQRGLGRRRLLRIYR